MEGVEGRVPGRTILDVTASCSAIAHPWSTLCKLGRLLWLSNSPGPYDDKTHSFHKSLLIPMLVSLSEGRERSPRLVGLLTCLLFTCLLCKLCCLANRLGPHCQKGPSLVLHFLKTGSHCRHPPFPGSSATIPFLLGHIFPGTFESTQIRIKRHSRINSFTVPLKQQTDGAE